MPRGDADNVEFTLEKFPPLGQQPPPTSPMSVEERLLRLEQDNRHIKKDSWHLEKDSWHLEKDSWHLEKDIRDIKCLALGWCTRDLMVCAGEILKWSMAKEGSRDGDGGQLFDPAVSSLVQRVATAVGMQDNILEFKHLSQRCIVATNNTAPLQGLGTLDALVACCKNGISFCPSLRNTHADQCLVIENYNRLKCALPECFC